MACDITQIKKDAFDTVKAIIEGKSSTIIMDKTGKVTFDYGNSKTYKTKEAAYRIAQDRADKVEQWASEKFGAQFSAGWVEVFSNEQEVTAQYRMPANLVKAYEYKIALDEQQESQSREIRDSRKEYLREILDNPQSYQDIYGHEYTDIDSLVNGIVVELQELEEVDDQIGQVPLKMITPNYETYHKEKKQFLKRVEKTINRLYTEKRIDNTKGISKRINQLTALKEDLERDIDTYSSSNDKFAQVKSFFTKDIALIDDLVSNPTLDNLFLAQDVFRFIKQSADINDPKNLLFKSDSHEVYDMDVQQLIEDLNTQVAFIQKKINNALDIEFERLLETYSEPLTKLYPGKDLDAIRKELLDNLQDISKVETMFYTVDNNLFSEADILGQLLRVEYTKINEKEKSRTQKLIQTIDGAIPALETELKKTGNVIKTKAGTFYNYNWLYQTDEKGNPQPELVGTYSSSWDKFIYNLNKDYSNKIFTARQTRNWTELEELLTHKYNDLNNTTEFVDFSLLHDIHNSAEYDEFKKGTPSEAAAYRAELISKIGEEEFSDLVERQRNYLDSYMEERDSMIQLRLKQEGVATVDALPQQVRDNLKTTLDRLNPALFMESHKAGRKSMIEYTIGTQSNEKPSYIKYNTYIPKKVTSAGISTDFYDSRMENIKKNDAMYNFWKIARNSTKTINENLIDSNLNLDKNSILLFKKNFRETLMDKSYGAIVKAGLGKLINIKQFIKNQISGKDIDTVEDGEIQLPMNIGTFQSAIDRNFRLMITDLANIMKKQMAPGTELSWANISSDKRKEILALVGMDSEADFLKEMDAYLDGRFRVYNLKVFSQKKVFEHHTLNVPSMLKAQLELSAEHKSRSQAKNSLDVILQKSKQVLSRKKRKGNEENNRSAYWGKDRKLANARNEFFYKQVILNDKKDPAWGNISNQLKVLANEQDGKILGKFFYKNYTPEEKAIYYAAMKRLEQIGKDLPKADEKKQKSLMREQMELESRLRILGKDYLGSAIFDAAFNKLSILVNMGFSIPVAINNYANGHLMLFSRDGEFWTKGNINLAWHYVTQNKLRFINPSYKESWKMMGAFIKQLNIIQDGTNELQRAEDNVSFLQKGLLHPMYGTELVEWYNQVPGILSMAMDIEIAPGIPLFDGKTFPAHKLVDGVFTLKDEYRTPENIQHYEEISSEKMLNWKLGVNDMIRSLNGDYSKTGVTRIKGGVIGKQVMQFKTWLPEYISARYAYKQKDIVSGEEKSGYLISALMNPKTSIAAGITTLSTLAIGAMSGPTLIWMLPLLGPAIGVAAVVNLARKGKLNLDMSEMTNIKSQITYAAKALTIGTIETPVNLIGGAFGKKTLIDLDNSFKGKLNPQETKDLQVLAKHMQFSLGILLLRLIVQSLIGDNDEDEPKGEESSAQRERWKKQQKEREENKGTYNLLENFLTSRFQELNLANDPIALASTMGSKNGLENNTDKVAKAMYNTATAFFFPEDDLITQGPKAGQSKAGNSWRKFLLPSPIRSAGQDNWQLGFETWTQQEWQNNDFTDKVFDSDFKIDKKQNSNIRKMKRQELLEQYNLENEVKFKDLDPEQQEEIQREIKAKAKEEVPVTDRELYDEEQQLVE